MRYLPPLKDFYADQKDAIITQIGEAFKKYEGESTPAPTRGPVLNVPADKAEDGEG